MEHRFFFFYPQISLSTQRLQTVPCMDSLFSQYPCCCVQMYSANVCEECVLWLKYKITVFSRCMGWLHISPVLGDMLDKMSNCCEVPVFHKQFCVAYLILVKTSEISN